jgi:predicted CXXCH cytochrome family protein
MGMRLWALLLICLVSLSGIAYADRDRDMSSGVPMPAIPMGQGETCVADNDYMRRNHMDLLNHQRDETMLKGLRNDVFSLKDCISCHMVKGADAQAVTADDPKHFCRACHDYAAVSIDCFQCHASRPDVASFSGSQ